MKKNLYFFVLAVLTICFVACSKDESDVQEIEVSIENLSQTTSVAQQDTIYLKAVGADDFQSAIAWAVDGKVENTKNLIFKFVSSKLGSHSITLSCGDVSAEINLEVYEQFRHGTFILNEGNMTTENGSLIFISPQGVIVDNAYRKVNGTDLGNVCQDLYITPDKKMYIISQNGRKNPLNTEFDNDGMLVVANALTLKKEAAYNDELSILSWPTHIAVLNQENVFIRDNAGVYVFNTVTKELKFVEGSQGAGKNTMAVINQKVFVPCGEKILVLEAGKTTVSGTIDIGAYVSGVIKSSDGNIWVSTTGSPHKIAKINSTNYSKIKENEITMGSVSTGMLAATPGICAKGNILYFSGLTEKIYRHDFTTGITEFMVDAFSVISDATIVYNTIAVHPVTGEVWMNTLKGFGWAFLKNNILAFDFSGSEPKLVKNYTDYTHFPAGIFFTYNFE
jgi:hypothetical protein